jgi:hypothetical protein
LAIILLLVLELRWEQGRDDRFLAALQARNSEISVSQERVREAERGHWSEPGPVSEALAPPGVNSNTTGP